MNRMGRAALELAVSGWPVIPLRGKQPTTGLTPHGHHDATKSPRTVRQWWADEEWNIGCPVPEGTVVFDVDPRNGGSRRALEQAAGVPLARTLTTRTGSGGWHLYYMRPWEHVASGNLPPGIDFKPTGSGYMVMPPSVHPDTGRRYVWNRRPIAHMTLELARLVLATPTERPDVASYDIGGLVSWLLDRGRGDRHNGLHWAARRVNEAGGGARHLDQLVDAAEYLGINRREARRVVESAQKGSRS